MNFTENILRRRWLTFDGLMPGVELCVDSSFEAAIGSVFSGWSFALKDIEIDETFAAVVYDGEKYTLSSPFMDAPETYADPVNTLCRLIVEVAWAQLRARPEMLCLHGAAIEVNGRLVVFPSTRRAGKSILSVGMMAAGKKLFTDDFLPLLVNAEGSILGFAQGISPRLRLPLPAQIGRRIEQYLERRDHAENGQYSYVVPGPGDAAPHGQVAPIGALVFLERTDAPSPELTEINASEALQFLITQNFARSMNSPAILNILSEIATNVPAYRLTYSNVGAAVDLVSDQFQKWSELPASVSKHDARPAPEYTERHIPDDWRSSQLLQMPKVSVVSVAQETFLAGNSERDIVVLNGCASGIWQLLAEPTTFKEILTVLCAAFPDQDMDQLKKDAEMALQSFVDHQFVRVTQAQADSGVEHRSPDQSYTVMVDADGF